MAARKTPSGGPKPDKLWRQAILRAIKRRASGDDHQALERLADQLIAKGLTGDLVALREIGDRLDGRPSQAMDMNHTADPNQGFLELLQYMQKADKALFPLGASSRTTGQPRRS